MVDVLLVINGMLLSVFIGGIYYFHRLLHKQKSDMEKFSELHQKTLQRNKVYEEQMEKLLTSVNDLKAKPINQAFGGRINR